MDLLNPANWSLMLSESLTGLPLPYYAPLIEFDKRIVAISINNSQALDTWDFAGRFFQVVSIGSTPAQNAELFTCKLWLKRTQMIVLPQLAVTYKIGIQFPKWFDRATCTVWQYQGLDF